jgi:hypothetical protein
MRRRSKILAAGLAALLHAVTSPALAQEVLVKAGVGASGFVAGASFFVARGDPGGLQIELLLQRKGARNVLRQDDRLRLLDLEVPLLMHMDLRQRGGDALYVSFGPSVAFNLGAEHEAAGMVEDVRADIEDVGVSFSVGGGVELGPIVIDARYTWGLRDVITSDAGAYTHRTLAITAGIRWRNY